MNNIVNLLNSAFAIIPEWNTKIRKSKISNINAVKYRFKYANIGTTKEQIKSDINFKSKKNISRTSYDRKENNISNKLYCNILDKIRNYYNTTYDNNKGRMTIISVDGTFNNTNMHAFEHKLETSLNMGYYDTVNEVPIDLTFNQPNGKNTEIQQLKNYIEAKNLTNIIIVADRAYFKYEFFDYLDSKNIYYVIRVKSNSHLLTNVKNNNKQKDLINKLKNNTRIINYTLSNTKNLISKKGNKINVISKDEYNLITNLTNIEDYTDANIKEIYNSRWKVEVYFKFVKSNFKFSHLVEKKEEQYNKLITIQMILTYICKIIKQEYLKTNENALNINESNIIKGIFDNMLDLLLESSLTVTILSFFIESYGVTVNNEPNRKFPRTCKSPFKKWYIKMYHDLSKYTRLKKCLDSGNINDLDKNLKLKLKNIQINIT